MLVFSTGALSGLLRRLICHALPCMISIIGDKDLTHEQRNSVPLPTGANRCPPRTPIETAGARNRPIRAVNHGLSMSTGSCI